MFFLNIFAIFIFFLRYHIPCLFIFYMTWRPLLYLPLLLYCLGIFHKHKNFRNESFKCFLNHMVLGHDRMSSQPIPEDSPMRSGKRYTYKKNSTAAVLHFLKVCTGRFWKIIAELNFWNQVVPGYTTVLKHLQ